MIWHLQSVRGSREAVKSNVIGQKIPDDVKAFIVSQIDSLSPDVVGCTLDAYCQDVSNPGAMRITRNVQITIAGLTL